MCPVSPETRLAKLSRIGRLPFPRTRTSYIQRSAGRNHSFRTVRCTKETLAIRTSGIAVVQPAAVLHRSYTDAAWRAPSRYRREPNWSLNHRPPAAGAPAGVRAVYFCMRKKTTQYLRFPTLSGFEGAMAFRL